MRSDIGFYTDLAHQTAGPWWNSQSATVGSRSPSHGPPGGLLRVSTTRPHARTSQVPRRRGGCAVGSARVRYAGAAGRRARGVDLLPVPGAAACADLVRSSSGLRACSRSAGPGGRFAWNAFAFDHEHAVALSGVREDVPAPHSRRYAVGDNRIDLVCEDGTISSPVVGDQERVARPHRRRRLGTRGAVRRVRWRTVHRRQPRVRIRSPAVPKKRSRSPCHKCAIRRGDERSTPVTCGHSHEQVRPHDRRLSASLQARSRWFEPTFAHPGQGSVGEQPMAGDWLVRQVSYGQVPARLPRSGVIWWLSCGRIWERKWG